MYPLLTNTFYEPWSPDGSSVVVAWGRGSGRRLLPQAWLMSTDSVKPLNLPPYAVVQGWLDANTLLCRQHPPGLDISYMIWNLDSSSFSYLPALEKPMINGAANGNGLIALIRDGGVDVVRLRLSYR